MTLGARDSMAFFLLIPPYAITWVISVFLKKALLIFSFASFFFSDRFEGELFLAFFVYLSN